MNFYSGSSCSTLREITGAGSLDLASIRFGRSGERENKPIWRGGDVGAPAVASLLFSPFSFEITPTLASNSNLGP